MKRSEDKGSANLLTGRRGMHRMTSEWPDVQRPTLKNLRAVLAAHLPGLGETDLDSLALRCGDELQLRVGSGISEALSPEQDAELERLVDDNDEAKLDK